jgi:uncharacterized protein YggE
MRITTLRAVLVLVCAMTALTASPAQEPPKVEGRRIVATGTITVSVPPDAARLTFLVTTTEGTEKSIREANESHVKRIKDAIVALPVEQPTIETHLLPASFGAIVTVQQQNPPVRVPQSKKAQTIVQITVRDKNLDKLRTTVAKIGETATDLGGTGIEPNDPLRAIRLPPQLGGPAEQTEPVSGPTIEWLALGSGAARRAALRQAYEEALADAQAIAGDSKELKVAEVYVMPEDSPLVRYRPRGEATVTENAAVPIKVQVRVTCTY